MMLTFVICLRVKTICIEKISFIHGKNITEIFKTFSNLYLAKFSNTSAKSFLPFVYKYKTQIFPYVFFNNFHTYNNIENNICQILLISVIYLLNTNKNHISKNSLLYAERTVLFKK